MDYVVRTEVFEGPFDLLLHLIARQRVDIWQVSLSRITEDYLAEIRRMRQLNLEVATEFLVVAATLLELKAARLLPAPDADTAESSGSGSARGARHAARCRRRGRCAAGGHAAVPRRLGPHHEHPRQGGDRSGAEGRARAGPYEDRPALRRGVNSSQVADPWISPLTNLHPPNASGGNMYLQRSQRTSGVGAGL